jgi:hypothetical protein
MIEKDFTKYPEALELKELGFDQPCLTYIYTGDTGNNVNRPCAVLPSKAKNFNEDDLCVSTPTYSQAFRWFREKYGLCIVIKPIDDKKLDLGYNLTKNGLIMNAHLTYEEAELACIKELIEIVKNKR